MVHAKTHVFQVLTAVVLFCCLWFGSSGRVRAEEITNHYSYFYHIHRFSYNAQGVLSLDSEYMLNYDSNLPVAGFRYSYANDEYGIAWSVMTTNKTGVANPSFKVVSRTVHVGSISEYSVGFSTSSFYGEKNRYTTINKDAYEIIMISTDMPIFETREQAVNYLNTGDTTGRINIGVHVPEWTKADYTPILGLKNFTANIQDKKDLVASWDGVLHQNMIINEWENTYVRVELGFAPYGMPGASVKVTKEWKDVYTFKDNGFTIPLADMDMPEATEAFPDGFQLNWVKATPYYYANDDISEQLFVGRSSVVYFDADGNASQTVEQAPSESYDDEDPEQSIWQSITNFFGGFYKNLTDMLYNLVVPDSEELMSLFQEINDWFSDRLGFIWYPFDLALQLVDALANGEANGMFKVPGLTLNMFDGVTLWNEFEVDIDQFGIFQYVRYFTSVLLVCGVAHMAIDKWDEWIGGHNI